MGSLLDEIYDSEHLLCRGLHEINENGELNKETLEMMGELMDAAKDMYEIQMRAEYPPEDYSHGYSRNGDYMSYDGQSYAQRRDSRGRYARSYGRDSRGYSRERANSEMISWLEEKMKNARDENEREEYRHKIIELENGH